MGRNSRKCGELIARTVEKFQVVVVHIFLVDETVVGIGRQPGNVVAGTEFEATVLRFAPVLELIDFRIAIVNARNLLDNVIDKVVERTGMPPQILPMALIGGIDIDGFLCSQVGIGDGFAEFIGIPVLSIRAKSEERLTVNRK